MRGETALLILLQRWNFPCKLVRLQHIFGIHYSTISLALSHLVAHLVANFTTLLTDNLDFFVTRFPLYRASILGAHLANGNEVPDGLINVVGFVDGVQWEICRPGGDLQRAVYSGKTKLHSMKSQGLLSTYYYPIFLMHLFFMCRCKLSRWNDWIDDDTRWRNTA